MHLDISGGVSYFLNSHMILKLKDMGIVMKQITLINQHVYWSPDHMACQRKI